MPPSSVPWLVLLVGAAAPPPAPAAQARNPVDEFILAKLEARGRAGASVPDRRALVRRLTLDLTGVPPTPEEEKAFLEDTRPDACERLIDRLLASPAYAERWGKRWLDAARHAEGGEAKGPEWKYRDYVVRAFNEDVPDDPRVREKLAGDSSLAGKEPAASAPGDLPARPTFSIDRGVLANGVLVAALALLLLLYRVVKRHGSGPSAAPNPDNRKGPS